MQYDETGRPLVDETGRPLDWAPSYDSQRANYLPYQIQRFGLNIGDPGTVTLYGDLAAQDGNRVSTTPGAGLTPFAAYDPSAAGFVQPLEGWQRFYDQAFSGNGIQEEYAPPSAYGAKGMDTTNFDWMKNLNPFAKDWNVGNATYAQKERTPWYKDLNVILPASILAATAGGLLASGYGSAAGELSAIGPAQGSILEPGLQASGAMTYPVANPYAGIEAIGAGAGGGALTNELIYSDIGPAQGSVLPPGVQESGAITYPVEANPYAGITAKPTGSIWDTAKDVLKKMPSTPPGTGSGQATGAGGDEGEQMNIWSETATPKAFGAVQPYQPTYLNLQQAAFPFEAELQRRLALIRGAQ
jgi:hypothetical protein